jgi:hypothetical protein
MKDKLIKSTASVVDVVACAQSALGFKMFAKTASKICFDDDESIAVIQELRPSRYKDKVHVSEGNSKAAKEICGDIDVRKS